MLQDLSLEHAKYRPSPQQFLQLLAPRHSERCKVIHCEEEEEREQAAYEVEVCIGYDLGEEGTNGDAAYPGDCYSGSARALVKSGCGVLTDVGT
jgi:hypothetical protein